MTDLERELLRERMVGMPRWQVRKMRGRDKAEPMPEWSDLEIAQHRKVLGDYYPAMEETG